MSGSDTPDPNNFKNAVEVTGQLKEVQSNISSLSSTIQLASALATLAGVDSPFSGRINDLLDQSETLATDVTTDPATLERRRAIIEAQFNNIKEENENAIIAENIKKYEAIINKIEKRLKEVTADPNTTQELWEEYSLLLENAKLALENYKKFPFPPELEGPTGATTKEGFQTATGPLIPDIPTALDLEKQLDVLDLKKEDSEAKEFVPSRLLRRTFTQLSYYLWIVVIAIGFLFGGIFLSNSYVNEPFWAIRLFYFVYGALAFPATFLYTTFQPTYLYASLIPLVIKGGASATTPQTPGIPLPFFERLKRLFSGLRRFTDPFVGYSPGDVQSPLPKLYRSRIFVRFFSLIYLIVFTGISVYELFYDKIKEIFGW